MPIMEKSESKVLEAAALSTTRFPAIARPLSLSLNGNTV